MNHGAHIWRALAGWPTAGRRCAGTIVQAATDLLLPPGCNFCGQPLPMPGRQPLLCADCVARIVASADPVCPRCAAPAPPLNEGPDCPRCRQRRYAFHSARALGVYRDRLREMVIRMKQRAHEPLTLSAGYLMAEKLGPALRQDRPDVLVPVPSHWWKRMVRGVNGPDLLVEALSARLDIPAAKRILFCRRRTQKQGMLLPPERFRNVRDAFGCRKSYDLKKAHVMLVDDILTTGATASQAARTLRRGGATRVSVLVVARGVGLDHRTPP